MEGVISKMESVENMMKEWKDSKLYHISWMTEEKEKKFQKHLEQLHLLKKKKEALKQSLKQIQEDIESVTEDYEEELKRILELLASNMDAMGDMSIEKAKKEIEQGHLEEDSFVLDIDRGDPIFIDKD